MISIENWNYCHYTQGSYRSQITFGAQQHSKDIQFLYWVTLLDPEMKEVMQKTFFNLDDACVFINKKYHNWNFIDPTAKQDKGSCSTCSAH